MQVEYGSCPAVVLLCPDSTGTSYFRGIGPYLRAFLHHDAVQFKDYSGKPRGFGIMLVCIAHPDAQGLALMQRFASMCSAIGTVTMPVDRGGCAGPACEGRAHTVSVIVQHTETGSCHARSACGGVHTAPPHRGEPWCASAACCLGALNGPGPS